MGRRWLLLSVVLLVLAAAGPHWRAPTVPPVEIEAMVPAAGAQPPLPPGVRQVRTTHYLIRTAADEPRTRRIGEAAEALYRTYIEFFPELVPPGRTQPPLQLVLYRDQAQFKAFNRSKPWAEAYYLPPRCHAYYGDDENPVHWMVHEATHQLNREVAGLKRVKWIDEGLANYFGSSFLSEGKLIPGSIDAATYPIWWLPRLRLSGDLPRDVAEGRFIPLRAIVSGTGGPAFDRNVNLYYMEYWGLTHFLFHYREGKYAPGYRALIRAGGTTQDFERLVGPFDQVENEWYRYLQKAAEAVTTQQLGEGAARARVAPPPAATK